MQIISSTRFGTERMCGFWLKSVRCQRRCLNKLCDKLADSTKSICLLPAPTQPPPPLPCHGKKNAITKSGANPGFQVGGAKCLAQFMSVFYLISTIVVLLGYSDLVMSHGPHTLWIR